MLGGEGTRGGGRGLTEEVAEDVCYGEEDEDHWGDGCDTLCIRIERPTLFRLVLSFPVKMCQGRGDEGGRPIP